MNDLENYLLETYLPTCPLFCTQACSASLDACLHPVRSTAVVSACMQGGSCLRCVWCSSNSDVCLHVHVAESYRRYELSWASTLRSSASKLRETGMCGKNVVADSLSIGELTKFPIQTSSQMSSIIKSEASTI